MTTIPADKTMREAGEFYEDEIRGWFNARSEAVSAAKQLFAYHHIELQVIEFPHAIPRRWLVAETPVATREHGQDVADQLATIIMTVR